MEEIRLQSMHQLHEKMEEIQGFRIFREIPKIRKKKTQSNRLKCKNTPLFIPKCDPSSQPSQLYVDYARNSEFKTQNPKLRKLGKNLEKLHTLSLIRDEILKIL
jgi:hypothetical protein